MAVLLAPQIESKLPAQYYDEQTASLIIPFTLNRAVNRNDFSKIYLKIKTASTNINVGDILESYKIVKENNIYKAFFYFEKNKFTIGQYYKAQIAFVNVVGGEIKKQDVGMYSTVGIFKYTTKPKLSILNSYLKELDTYGSNPGSFLGQTILENDITEKVDKYKFDIFDENDNLVQTSGFQIHDMSNDEQELSENGNIITTFLDSFILKIELNPLINYYIVYTVQTTNKLQISTDPYWIKEANLIKVPFPGKLIIQGCEEDGYFNLKTVFTESRVISGSYKILRTDERSEFKLWEPIHYISFAEKCVSINEELEFFKDFTVEQGIKYKYALQQYSDSQNIYIRKELFIYFIDACEDIKIQDTFVLNFEDMYLYDGERQLKIEFNPKVSSFKNHVLENKIDTIGNPYPFFFRNGIVNYKEFPVAGLISCHMDENQLFFNHGDIDTQLTYDNILEERKFKLEVLNWLSNGKTKLFRSPAEGNYIVQLMKVSLKPMDKLGRMLHNFTSTAYEVLEYNYLNLLHEGLLDNEIHEFNSLTLETKIVKDKLEIDQAYYADIIKRDNRTFGEEILLTFANGKTSEIAIGYTNFYRVQIEQDNPLTKIEIKNANSWSSELEVRLGYINRAYEDSILDRNHQKIINFNTTEEIEQFYGEVEQKNLIECLNLNSNLKKSIITYLEYIPYCRIQSKIIVDVWHDAEGNYYTSDDFFYESKVNYLLSTVIYHDNTDNIYSILVEGKLQIIEYSQIDTSYYIKYKNGNQEETIISDLNSDFIELDLSDFENISALSIGSGLYADVVYYKTSYETA